MARFVWRLQKILDLKKRLEELRRLELMHIAQQMAQMQALLWAQQEIVERTCRQITRLPAPERPLQQGLFMRYVAYNDQKISQIKAEIDRLKTEQARITKELLEIRRSKEGLERLREKAWQQFVSEQSKLEQKQTDEMAAIGFVREGLGLPMVSDRK